MNVKQYKLMSNILVVITLIISLVIMFGVYNANAAEGDPVGLAWDAPSTTPENQVEGYNVWWSTETGKYPNRLDVGNVLLLSNIVEVLNLESSTTYYFVVTAYNSTGNSGYSNEPNYETPMVLKAPPSVIVTIKVVTP